jgi:hypothetical protein
VLRSYVAVEPTFEGKDGEVVNSTEFPAAEEEQGAVGDAGGQERPDHQAKEEDQSHLLQVQHSMHLA